MTRNYFAHVFGNMCWQNGFGARVDQHRLRSDAFSIDDLVAAKKQLKVIHVSTSLNEYSVVIQ